MPTSYQSPSQGDATDARTSSQSQQTNVSNDRPTVGSILDQKGGNIISISASSTVQNAVMLLKEKRIGALAVTDQNGALCGILSERDIVRKLAETPGQTLPQVVKDLMTSSVKTCTPGDDLLSVLRTMTDGRFRHMPVVQDDRLIGMVTIGDVVNFRLTQLEHEALQLKQLIVG